MNRRAQSLSFARRDAAALGSGSSPTDRTAALAGARVVVTDSGGLQEEAAYLGVPVVVLRRSTPRWERAELGASVLTGIASDADGDRAVAEDVAARDLVVVGDRPDKDVAIAAALGARSLRVRTGEYAACADEPAATLTVSDLPAAAGVLLAR